MAVWRGLVKKHAGKEKQGFSSLAETQMGSDQSVVKKSALPFFVPQKMTFCD